MHLILPLLFRYNLKISPTSKVEKNIMILLDEFRLAVTDLKWFIPGFKLSIHDQLYYFRRNQEECYDTQLGKTLGLTFIDCYSYESYQNIFEKIDPAYSADNFELNKYFKKSKDFYLTRLKK